MKKIIFSLCVAGVAMSFSSCKKAYSCVCSAPPSTTKDIVSQYENVTKADATKLCDEYVTTYALRGTVLSCSVN